jgi:hypothetical protein
LELNQNYQKTPHMIFYFIFSKTSIKKKKKKIEKHLIVVCGRTTPNAIGEGLGHP